jgi:chemotaxis protein CheD
MKVIKVGMADFKIARSGEILTSIGLGSCVAIVLYDEKMRLGGLGHIMLPERSLARDKSNPAKFADSCTDLMLRVLKRKGSKNIKAKLFGGANMFPSVKANHLMNIGNRNSAAAKKILKMCSIPIVASDLGGNCGRTVTFTIDTGQVEVKSIGKLEKVF